MADYPARPSLVSECTADKTTLVLLMFDLPGYGLSATRCRVDCEIINAGYVTLGESLAGRSREASLISNYR